ncbi:MAG TPA: AtpZ/AtpI family protein [Armatimonadota bacterium]|nr:AtpZ/AtpI family protein [Armatimonadota bacterium]HOS44169.1 AtpZ/AtpI family protein [Armatimonadota bacterium]
MARRRPTRDLGGLALLAGSALLVLLTVGGYSIGNLLDQRLGTAPTLAIVGLLLGVVIGFWDLFRIAAMVMRAQPLPPPPRDALPEPDDASRDDEPHTDA